MMSWMDGPEGKKVRTCCADPKCATSAFWMYRAWKKLVKA